MVNLNLVVNLRIINDNIKLIDLVLENVMTFSD